ncbi:MAG: hypothetical protein IPJ30_14175 [Acidobacteria bacterium]|nr:hypothetical protein [Acidobacteriota bacterium]
MKTPIEAPRQIEPPPQMSPEEQVRYRSPIRYVVVFNEVNERSIRQIEILLDEKSFDEQTLCALFASLGRRYPTPSRLEVEIHTSLDTVETPEERLMLRDSDDSRFSDVYFKHKKASFTRFENGREAFIYTTSLAPYETKVVRLKE